MSLSFVSVEGTADKVTSPFSAARRLAAHLDDDASPHHADMLTTLSLAATPDVPVGAQMAPACLTFSSPGIHAGDMTASAASEATPTAQALHPSSSVCFREMNNYLIVDTLTSSPRPQNHVTAASLLGIPDTNGNNNSYSSVPDGGSDNLDAQPSPTTPSQQQHHESEPAAMEATAIGTQLNMLRSTAAPSSSRAPQLCALFGVDDCACKSCKEGLVKATAVAAASLSSPSNSTSLGDQRYPPCGVADSEGFPSPRQPDSFAASHACHPSGIHEEASDTFHHTRDAAHKNSAWDRERCLPSKALLSSPRDVPLLNDATASMSHSVLHAATTTGIAATTTTANASLSTITPHAVSMPLFLEPCTRSRDNNDSRCKSATRKGLSTSLVSAASLPSCSSSTMRPSHSKRPARLMTWIRSRVSQNKVRFREGDFNLDLTYITPQIVAMGYPAHGREYYIRNPIDEVERFFDERHPGHFCIYNLCSERYYDHVHRFHGCFRRFPFDDHNAPSLSLMLRFVLDAATFLRADEENVVAIHCKAGKGRTGIMVSCLLLYLYPDRFATADAAIRFFNQRRTRDGEGMTIPSQRRYVNYFESILRDFHGNVPPVQRRLAIKEVVIRIPHVSSLLHPGDLYFIVSDHHQILLDSRTWFPRGPTVSPAGCMFSFATHQEGLTPVTLVGDIKFSFFRRRPIVLSGLESTACYLWFNTALCPSLQMVYNREDLDKVDVVAVGKSVMVSLSLDEVGEEGDAASHAPQPEGSTA
ncbi:putative tyrosine phosphatase [Leptomonas seymouri]|uniref:Phosphatidylinositol 3,4,5-trisphosphate 3-phosphatase and dual-specificity protein phosphatase PTEN n=1 Tax=Leptomonas seymouri TaxID=5684 RepID=A0A0N0P510_LEPSE|nr:putative tyrosine phosphatase [Leptomonas seymouri]|eukprot:KPI85919.1 putative tyrosine phosphatase [Leptomonas seymouri]